MLIFQWSVSLDFVCMFNVAMSVSPIQYRTFCRIIFDVNEMFCFWSLFRYFQLGDVKIPNDVQKRYLLTLTRQLDSEKEKFVQVGQDCFRSSVLVIVVRLLIAPHDSV